MTRPDGKDCQYCKHHAKRHDEEPCNNCIGFRLFERDHGDAMQLDFSGEGNEGKMSEA